VADLRERQRIGGSCTRQVTSFSTQGRQTSQDAACNVRIQIKKTEAEVQVSVREVHAPFNWIS